MNVREYSTQETTEISNNNKTQLKTKKIPSDLIHSRFHKSEEVIATINSETLWEDVRVIPSIDKFCTSCKITSIPHRARVKMRNSTPRTFLEEIQVDTVPNPEPLGVLSETRAKFFLIFCDRYSRIFRVAPMKDKTSLKCAKAIEGMLSRITNSSFTAKDITYLRSDAGTEFRSNDFNDWCKENPIVFMTAAPKHQEQNGLVERHWTEVSKLANTMLVHARLNTKIILYALKYAEKIHGVIPVRNLVDEEGKPTTPYYMAFKRHPKVSHFRVFGCPAVFKRYKVSAEGKRTVNKSMQQGMRRIFVGIPDDSAGWLFYVPTTRKTYISLDASFDENFTSPLALPSLPFKGALKLRGSSTTRNNEDKVIEMTGVSVTNEETYPVSPDLPLPTPEKLQEREQALANHKRGPITRSSQEAMIVDDKLTTEDQVAAYSQTCIMMSQLVNMSISCTYTT